MFFSLYKQLKHIWKIYNFLKFDFERKINLYIFTSNIPTQHI